MSYDSREETKAHIAQVQNFLNYVVRELEKRKVEHDRSKLEAPEKEIFDEFTPRLKDTTYLSSEYKECLVGMKEALDHHYSTNPHHPEHHVAGILGMTLIDLLEMMCDWYAATKRHNDGDIIKSIEANQKRFGYGEGVKTILMNTAQQLISYEQNGDCHDSKEGQQENC